MKNDLTMRRKGAGLRDGEEGELGLTHGPGGKWHGVDFLGISGRAAGIGLDSESWVRLFGATARKAKIDFFL